MKNEMYTEISEQFLRIVNKFNILEKIPMDFGTGEKLHSSEIHTLVAIAKNPEVNMSKLARISGVTRGAIHQIVNKLVDKALVEKYSDEDNKNAVLLKLTDKGITAYNGHEKMSVEMFSEIMLTFDKLKIKELNILLEVFGTVEFHIDKYTNDLNPKR